MSHYNKTCVTSKDSDQPVHPPSMAWILVCPFLDSAEAVEGTCDKHSGRDPDRLHRAVQSGSLCPPYTLYTTYWYCKCKAKCFA